MSMAYQPKSYRKFLAGTVSAAVVASAIAPVASAASFTDVAGSMHADDIATLVAKGYIKGYADGTFKPNKPLTRGEAAIIFSRILKDAGVKAPEQGAGFPDVPASKAELAEAVAIVKAAGVMGGDEKGNFNPNANITREQMAKVVVEAFKLTKPANHTTKITDLDKAGSWAREYIQTLEANGVTKNTEFAPKQNVTRGQFASFVVRAMDVKKEVSAADITAVKLVDEKTLEVTFNGELTNVNKDDFKIVGVEIDSVSIKAAAAAEAKTTVVVIKTKTALQEGKSYNVSYKGQTTDKAKVDVPVVTPKVESVSAINAKQLVIKFNKAIDKSTVIESDNTLVDGLLTVNALKKADGTNSAAVTPDAASASLSEDGKTLTVTLQTSEAFDGKYAVAVNKGVKTADGVEVPAYSVILDVKDTVAPEFVSATAEAKTTTRTVTVKFSEPVQSSGVIAYVNGKAATVSRPAGTPVDELVIQTSDDLQAGQSYELSLLNVKDYAGNLIATNPFKTQFTVTANTSAPTVKDVKVTGENKLEVTFDKAVDGNSFTINARILDVNGQLVTLLNATVKSGGKTVELTAASQIPFGPNGTFTGTLLIGSDVTDTLGNKLGTAYSKSVTFTKDTVAPTVTKVEYSNGKLVVTFSENITNKASDLTGSSVINDSTGVVTSLSSIAFGTTAGTHARIVNNNQLEIPVSLSAGSYTLRLAKGTVKDLAGTPNENAASINSFVVNATATNDTTAPTFTLVSSTNLVDVDVAGQNTNAAPNDEQTISYTVQDNSGLDLASVRDVNNYTLDGKPLPAGTYITTNYNGTDSAPLTVTLHLPSDKITESKTTYQLVISNIKDKAGNVAAPQVSEQFELHEGVKPVLKSATISSGDATTLVLGFTEAVQNVSADDFEFKVNGADITGAATLTSVTSGTDKGKYYVTFATVKDSNGKLYVDVDKSGDVSSGDVAIATTADAAGSLDLSKAYVSTLTVKVVDTADIADIQGNVVVKGTTIIVK